MSTKSGKRRRGVQLTAMGYDRLSQAKKALEARENQGDRFTLEALNERTGLSLGTLTRVLNREGVVDKRTLTIFFQTLGLELTPVDYTQPGLSAIAAPSNLPVTTAPLTVSKVRYDWGQAVDVSRFQHRRDELQILHQWMQQERCRLVALLGLGGMGKTYLAVKAGQEMQPYFERVLWRSLRHCPPWPTLLEDVLGFLTGQPVPQPTLAQLESALRAERCLIILDNLESLLGTDQRAGIWQPGYEGYGDLLRLFGTTDHQSCLLLTSREKPAELAAMVSNPAVQTLTLRGCSDISLAILQGAGLRGDHRQFQALCQRYGGMPLAIAMTANLIQDVFGGDVGQFLAQSPGILGDLRDLIETQFNRLDEGEQAIARWLAINRDSTPLAELAQDLQPPLPHNQLLASLESLRRRSLVEAQNGAFTLQSVVMAHISDRLVEEAFAVLDQASPSQAIARSCLHTHALLKAQATEPVQVAQRSQLLEPLVNRLLQNRRPAHLIQRLRSLLSMPDTANTYWSGNLVNLLIHLWADLSGQAWAGLTLWQVDFRGVHLAGTSLRQADLTDCRFSYTFGPVYGLAFGEHGQTLFSGHGDGEVRQWAIAGHLRHQVQQSVPVSALTYAATSQQLAVGTFDGTVHLYDIGADWQRGRSHPIHSDWVADIQFLPGKGPDTRHRWVSGSSDGTLHIWEADTGQYRPTVPRGPITAVSISQDGWLVSSDDTGTLQLWPVNGDTAAADPWQWQQASGFVSAAISADGTLVATVDAQQLQVWQRQGQALLPLWQAPLASPWKVAFSPQAATVAVTDGTTIQIFDAATSAPLQTLSGHPSQVWALAFDPTGTLLASGSDDQIRLWDLATGQPWRTWQAAAIADSPILAATLSRDGRYLVSGNGLGEVRLWDWRSHQCVSMMANHRQAVRSLAIAPDAEWIASGSDSGTVRLWHRQTHQDQAIMQHPQGITALAMSPDGHWLASGSADGTLQLWHRHRHRLEQQLSGHEGRVLAIAFSPDSQWLATSSSDYAIRLWPVGQTTPAITLRGHQGWVWAIAFSPDGQFLASGADDHTVKLWDWSQQTCVRTFHGHEKLVWSVAFWPHAAGAPTRLVSGSLDQTIQVWDVETAQSLITLSATTDLLWALQPIADDVIIAGTQGETLTVWQLATQVKIAKLTPPSPYAGLDICQVTGLDQATVNHLVQRGAIAR